MITEASSVFAFILLFSSAAIADGLPKTATPMSSDAIKRLYSGNTAIWKYSDLYFKADGSVEGTFGKPTITAKIDGTWSVINNEICIYTFRTKEPNSFRDCYQYWENGRNIISLWSIHSDGSPVDQNNGYHGGEDRNLKSGDLVSGKYPAAPKT